MLGDLDVVLKKENEAKALRYELESKIAEIMNEYTPPDGGMRTFDMEGVKFTIKTGYSFRIEKDGVEKIQAIAPEVLRTKIELSDSAYRKLWVDDKKKATALSAFITATPSKPYVRLAGISNEGDE